MFSKKLASNIIRCTKTTSYKFSSEAASLSLGPAMMKGSVGAVFAEDGKPFQVTLEESKVYSWCPCGQSKKKPFCDGSHKEINLKSEQKFKPIKLKVEKTGQYWMCNCRKTKNIPFCDGSHKQKGSPKAQETTISKESNQ